MHGLNASERIDSGVRSDRSYAKVEKDSPVLHLTFEAAKAGTHAPRLFPELPVSIEKIEICDRNGNVTKVVA